MPLVGLRMSVSREALNRLTGRHVLAVSSNRCEQCRAWLVSADRGRERMPGHDWTTRTSRCDLSESRWNGLRRSPANYVRWILAVWLLFFGRRAFARAKRHAHLTGSPAARGGRNLDACANVSSSMRDRDVRRLLHSSSLVAHRDDPETLVIEELGLNHGATRVDVAVVNGELHGFELKSARDTLGRLPLQVTTYNRVFDRVTLVAALRHLEKASQMIPSWWGLMGVRGSDEQLELVTLRAPGLNPAADAFAIAQLLWRQEALELLESRGLASGLRGASRRSLYEKLATMVPFDELKLAVRASLKLRKSWRVGGRQT